MDTFTLTIELGNAAMQDGRDVAHLMRQLASAIEDNDFTRVDGGRCLDINGNTVARWEVK